MTDGFARLWPFVLFLCVVSGVLGYFTWQRNKRERDRKQRERDKWKALKS